MYGQGVRGVEMKYCPRCHANVEGLVHHCDCCGALLSVNRDFFIWHAFTMSASGDLPDHLKEFFSKANSCNSEGTAANLREIVFDVYCYPAQMLRELKIRERMYYSKGNQKLFIKTVLCYEPYLLKGKTGKQEMVNHLLCSDLQKAAAKYAQRIPEIGSLALEISQMLQRIPCSKGGSV